MAMPSAKGLFHRAIIESGSQLRQSTPEESAKLAAAYLEELGLTASQVGRLHELPFEPMMAALAGAQRRSGLAWRPMADGKILPTQPFDPVAPSISANVPLLVGTVLNEQTHGINHPEYELMSDIRGAGIVRWGRTGNCIRRPSRSICSLSRSPPRAARTR